MEDGVLSFLAGNPKRSPPFLLYPDRRTDIWSPHEPQAPKRETHFLRVLLQMCAPPQRIFVLQPHSIYHTCCLVHYPPYPCMTAKHLPHPPSSTHTVQLVPPPHMATNQWEPQRSGRIVSLFLRDFFPFMEWLSDIEKFPRSSLYVRNCQHVYLMQKQQKMIKIMTMIDWWIQLLFSINHRNRNAAVRHWLAVTVVFF